MKIVKNCKKLREAFSWESEEIDYGEKTICCKEGNKFLSYRYKIHPGNNHNGWYGPGFYYNVDIFMWGRLNQQFVRMNFCPFCGKELSNIKKRKISQIQKTTELIAKNRRDEMERRYPI